MEFVQVHIGNFVLSQKKRQPNKIMKVTMILALLTEFKKHGYL